MYSNKDRKLSIAWNGMQWVIDRTSKIKRFIQMRKKFLKAPLMSNQIVQFQINSHLYTHFGVITYVVR